MKTRSNIKPGALTTNHNKTLIRPQPTHGLKIKSHLKAGVEKTGPVATVTVGSVVILGSGKDGTNHNQTLARFPGRGLRVRTTLKAGAFDKIGTTVDKNLGLDKNGMNHNETLARNSCC